MGTAIKIPDGASQKEREDILKEWATNNIKSMFDTSPGFKKSILRFWSRNGVKVKMVLELIKHLSCIYDRVLLYIFECLCCADFSRES